jgi:hypothetical protein
MSKDENDAEEFLDKIEELRKKLPNDEYQKVLSQVPYGFIKHAEAIRSKRRKKGWLIGLFVYLPIFVLLVVFFPQLIIMWVLMAIIPPIFKWIKDEMTPPTIRRY